MSAAKWASTLAESSDPRSVLLLAVPMVATMASTRADETASPWADWMVARGFSLDARSADGWAYAKAASMDDGSVAKRDDCEACS